MAPRTRRDSKPPSTPSQPASERAAAGVAPAAPSQRRRTLAPILEALHTLAAAVWLAGAVVGAVTASVAFSVLPGLKPTLADYAAFTGDHARLAAGKVAAPVFWIGDVTQFIAATIAASSLLGLLAFGGLRVPRFSTFLRLAALGTGLIAVSYQLTMLGPEMQAQLTGYWAEAAEGNTESAMAWQNAFMANHGTARTVTMVTVAAVVVLLASGAWSAASSGLQKAAADAPRGPVARPRYEEPELARRRP